MSELQKETFSIQWPDRPGLRQETTRIVKTSKKPRRFFSNKRKLGKGLIHSAAAGLVVLGGAKAYEIGVDTSNYATSRVERLLDWAKGQGEEENQQNITLKTQKIQEQKVAEENQQKTSFEQIFHHLTPTEHGVAGDKVRAMEQLLLSKSRDVNLKKYEELIRQSAQVAGIPENLFLGLVYAESGGDEHAVSYAGAKGLTQVMDWLAESWQDKGFNYTNRQDDDRFKPEKVLPYSASLIRGEYERFGDWGLAFWSWHAGDPLVYESVKTYFRNNHDILLPDIAVPMPENATDKQIETANLEGARIQALYKQKITEYGVSVHHVLSDPENSQKLAKPEYDRTLEYVYRIAAGERIYLANSDLVP